MGNHILETSSGHDEGEGDCRVEKKTRGIVGDEAVAHGVTGGDVRVLGHRYHQTDQSGNYWKSHTGHSKAGMTKVRVALCDSTGATEGVNAFESELRADGEDCEAEVGGAIRIY